MSHLHSECGNAIREVLAKVPAGLTRVQLYEAVNFFKKNEAVFGVCLSTMLQAGDLAELREPLKPTVYTLAGNAPVQQVHKAPILEAHGKGVQPSVTSRRQRLLNVLAKLDDPVTVKELDALLDGCAINIIRSDLQVLRDKSFVKSRPGLYRKEGAPESVWMLASKPWPVQPRSASEAHTAAPASAPSATPAQSAADLADHQQIEERLQLALRAAKDARTAYIAGCVDSKVLNGMDATVKATEDALQIHRQRRPA